LAFVPSRDEVAETACDTHLEVVLDSSASLGFPFPFLQIEDASKHDGDVVGPLLVAVVEYADDLESCCRPRDHAAVVLDERDASCC
jgi:hypothetical protein